MHSDVDFDFLLKIMLSLICGAIIGIERQVRGKPMGTRTCTLICLGTCMFMVLANDITYRISDPARVLGQIVSGVGFLGAGAVINKRGMVSGLTSAAVVWLLAGIGASIGLGHYMKAIIVAATCVTILVGIEKIESLLTQKYAGNSSPSGENDLDNN